jgi:hypothetical protein
VCDECDQKVGAAMQLAISAIRRRQTHDNDENKRDACRGPPSVSLLGQLSLAMVQVHCDFGIKVIQFGAEISSGNIKKKVSVLSLQSALPAADM